MRFRILYAVSYSETNSEIRLSTILRRYKNRFNFAPKQRYVRVWPSVQMVLIARASKNDASWTSVVWREKILRTYAYLTLATVQNGHCETAVLPVTTKTDTDIDYVIVKIAGNQFSSLRARVRIPFTFHGGAPSNGETAKQRTRHFRAVKYANNRNIVRRIP